MLSAQILLLNRFDRNSTYSPILVDGKDRIGIIAIGLVADALFVDKLSGNSFNPITQRQKTSAPIIAAGAGFHHHKAITIGLFTK
ncbi:hypothetical protein FVE88_20930 [Ectopseudomonas mendocina]|nr:hypothetical protein FVE88_20930 [Pseudomonas mendocina]